MEDEVISVRLKKGTKEKLKNLGIDPSKEVRRILEELAWRKDVRNTMDRLELIVEKQSKPSEAEFAIRSIREDRDESH
ncbi:MAG: VapB-type antitoxin [Thermoplasmataceae archaeon]